MSHQNGIVRFVVESDLLLDIEICEAGIIVLQYISCIWCFSSKSLSNKGVLWGLWLYICADILIFPWLIPIKSLHWEWSSIVTINKDQCHRPWDQSTGPSDPDDGRCCWNISQQLCWFLELDWRDIEDLADIQRCMVKWQCNLFHWTPLRHLHS